MVDLQKTVLDALHSHIALIDDAGTIRFVNEAWNRSVVGNALQNPSYGVGQNYIELCAHAQGDCSEQAREIGEGIRRVLRKELKQFSLQYPCHCPTGKRWFRVRVFPLREPAANGAVVLHTDITDIFQAEEAARQGESKHRTVARQLIKMLRDNQRVPDVTCTLDAKGHIVQINSACEALWGYKPDEMIGTKYLDYVLPDDRTVTTRAIAEIMSGHPPRDFDNRYVRKNGTITDMMWSANWSEADQNMFCVARDVTESHHAIESLQRNEAMLRNAQRIARFGSWELDLMKAPGVTETVSHWSDEVFRIFGYEPGKIEPTNENFFRAVHPEDRERVRQALAESIRLSIGYRLDHRIILSDGSLRYVHEEAQVFTDPHTGRPSKIIGIIKDVTERKAAEQKLAEQASLLDQARDAILLRDLESTVFFWNKGAERLYGWTSAEVIGRKTTDFLFSTLEKHNEAVETVQKKGEWTGDLDQITKAGDRVIVESRWTLVRDADGKPKSILVLNSDVTERKRIEAQLLRAQRTESIGTLAGGIAHDLNNMLAPILLGTVLLKSEEITEDMREVIEDIELSAKRGAELVKQVLSFARGTEGLRVSVRLADVVKEVVSIIKKTFSKKISLKIDIAGDLRLLVGDPTQLNQILLNVCVNARDAMPEGGSLTISAVNFDVDEQYAAMSPPLVVGRYVLIKIADTGCGIPPDKLDRIFDPFFTSKELGKGTGLGLATALGVVRSHRGFMNVYSEMGKGTTFTIHLPAQDEAAEIIAGEEETGDLPRGNGELILLVDDEPPILKVTGKTLKAYGYRILTASDGAKAIAVYSQHKHDIALVLTDMMMPVMDGPAAIRALMRINPRIKIIGASGLTSEGGVEKVRLAGIKNFIAKPYSAPALLQMVQSCLSEQTS